MRERGLASAEELQSWFIRRFDTFFAEHGRRLVGWDEILEGGLAPGATVMSWRGEEGGIEAAEAGHDVVMMPRWFTYFDYRQSDADAEPPAPPHVLPLERVCAYAPVPAGLSAAAHDMFSARNSRSGPNTSRRRGRWSTWRSRAHAHSRRPPGRRTGSRTRRSLPGCART